MGKAELLQSLNDSAAHNCQLDAWKADLEAFEGFQADNEDELRRLRAEIYQVVTLYVVFQGVIFTAVAQTSLLTCPLWWSPVSLSVSVAAVTFLAVAEKLYSIGEIQEEINDTGANISALIDIQDKVEVEGPLFDLEFSQPEQTVQKARHAGYRNVASLYGIAILIFLILFSILIASFCMKVLCRECPRCSSPQV